MLYSLKINNIALIDESFIEFNTGLNVLSGETGAGKSIIIGAMGLLLGDRADHSLIKAGRNSAGVEAVFFVKKGLRSEILNEIGIIENDDSDDSIIISRMITSDGKNICRINGVAVSLACLKNVMNNIIDIHGQHEHQSLLYPKNHLKLLDRFCGDKTDEIKEQIEHYRNLFNDTSDNLRNLGGSQEEILRQISYLEYQTGEIRAADIKPDEEDALSAELNILLNAEKLKEVFSYCYDVLYRDNDSVTAQLSRVVNRIQTLDNSEQYNDEIDTVNNAFYSLEDLAHNFRNLSESFYYDEKRHKEIDRRIELIHDLERKYGRNEAEVIEFYNNAVKKLNNLQNSDECLKDYENTLNHCRNKLYELHSELLQIRTEVAVALSEHIEKELDELGMSGSRFSVVFSDMPDIDETDFSRKEIVQAEFYISTNVGQPQKPLSKVASGGEISRIMLAFKSVFGKTDEIETLIFDEIDTGISGHIADVVAKKMSSVSEFKQVICVTHLPQIASFGDRNFLISKYVSGDNTESTVSELSEDEKIKEVARLSGGNSELSLKHAAEMIGNAELYKKGTVHDI